jgi:hypothetical protein
MSENREAIAAKPLNFAQILLFYWNLGSIKSLIGNREDFVQKR